MRKALLLLALMASSQVFAGYNLYCRGPLNSSNGGFMTIFHFNKSSSIGNTHLNPGECTWGDRVISNDEPFSIVVGNPVLQIGRPTDTAINPNVVTQVQINQLANLLLNKNLIITLNVEKKPMPGGLGVSTFTFIPDQGFGPNAVIKYEVNYSQL